MCKKTKQVEDVMARIDRLVLQSQDDLAQEMQFTCCRNFGVTMSGGFCANVQSGGEIGGNQYWDRPVARYLAGLFAGREVVELGAGLGHYIKFITNR